MWRRCLVTLGLWLTVGALSLWSLRRTFHQLADYFTWAAVKYGLAFNRPAAIGLGLCVGLTVSLLLKESRFLLFGLTDKERKMLERSIQKRRRHSGRAR
ncbi:MAG: hypothetical protein AAFX01_12960 [Cyanobacteria bacterium J06638_28]